MDILITHFREKDNYQEPLFRYLAAYMDEIEKDYAKGLFTSMDTVFAFLQSRMEEFLNANRQYTKPTGLALCYCRPSCCPPTIRMSYRNEYITIKILNHEKTTK